MSLLPPNATASTSFPGYNLSQPYPGTLLPDSKFSWELLLWGNVHFSNTTTFRTWDEFRLGVDDDLLKIENFKVDESWWFCKRDWRKSVGGDEEVGENCEGVVSDKCLAALRSFVETENFCDSPRKPRECENQGLDVSYRFAQNLHDWDGYWNDTGLLEDGEKAAIPGRFRDKHDKDNLTMYDEALREVSISIFGFGTTDKKGKDMTKALPGQLRCLVPKPVEGSRTVEEGAAGMNLAPGLIGGALVILSILLAL